MNCQYVLVYRKEVRSPTGIFLHIRYEVDAKPNRSTEPVVYRHGERADWTSPVGKSIKNELTKTFKLYRKGFGLGSTVNLRFNPEKIDEWWTAFLLPKNSKNASWAVYYTKEAMNVVAEYPGEKV